MDKNILMEYSAAKKEMEDLKRRIDKDRRELEKLNSMIVTDFVACGKKGKKPIRTVKIEGAPTLSIKRKQKALENKISKFEELELELLELVDQVEEMIESIEKSELRIMFRLYYIDDLSYIKVAERMNDMFPKRVIKYTDENVKKRIQRFLQNVSQCPEKNC